MIQQHPKNPICGKDTDVADNLQCSRSQVWYLLKSDPTFPRVVNITNGMTRWVVEEIRAWVHSRKTNKNPCTDATSATRALVDPPSV